jgi:hypothetical protein
MLFGNRARTTIPGIRRKQTGTSCLLGSHLAKLIERAPSHAGIVVLHHDPAVTMPSQAVHFHGFLSFLADLRLWPESYERHNKYT